MTSEDRDDIRIGTPAVRTRTIAWPPGVRFFAKGCRRHTRSERQSLIIIAQGLEAGGHRGTFTQGNGAGLIGTMALVPQVVDAVRVPVIAAGGIADGRGIAAAFALGASGVQIGTAFL